MVDVTNYLFLAKQARGKGNIDKEKSLLEEIIGEHDPSCLEAREGLVRIYLNERQYNLAEHHVSFLYIHSKNYKYPGQLLTIIEYAFIDTKIISENQFSDDNLFYDQVCMLSLAAKFCDDINKKSSFYIKLAKLYTKLGNYSRAIDNLKMNTPQSKHYIEGRITMGDIYRVMLKFEEAEACYKEANLYELSKNKNQ